jgi:hypothetical protein
MNAEQARAKIAANKADPVRRLDAKGKANLEKTIAFWDNELAHFVEHSVEYETPSKHASDWLGDTYRRGGLDEALELAVREHFQQRNIAFVRTRRHTATCECEKDAPCSTFYHLDVSPQS